MGGAEGASLSLLSAIDTEGPIEAVLFIRRTGAVLASWTRQGLTEDVMTVMAATMLASIDTMMTTLGSPGPRSVYVETDDRQILSTAVNSQAFLILIAPRAVGREYVRDAARRLLSVLPSQPLSKGAKPSPMAAQR
ncbi:MAG: roadblock/LC7 domain-containing protein [Thermoplasmata archaeon]|nr:roadblock/LC7 domain-containing protein [Thermoplasmata archaeon]